MEDNRLSGMDAICAYFGRSAPTILKLVREEQFPAEKIMGVWESEKSLIEIWRLRKIEGRKEKAA